MFEYKKGKNDEVELSTLISLNYLPHQKYYQGEVEGVPAWESRGLVLALPLVSHMTLGPSLTLICFGFPVH